MWLWQRWSLDTREPGKTCVIPAADYAEESDGRIALTVNRYARPIEIVATDVTTCEDLWRMPQPEHHRIAQIGTALVDRSPDELVDLRPAQ